MMPTLLCVAALASPDLDQICQSAFTAAETRFGAAKPKVEDIGIGVAVREAGSTEWREGGFNQKVRMYPASVVKAFYLAYAAWLKSSNRLNLTPEHQRAFRDMIVDSSNDATGLVLDLVTDTTGGAELPEDEMKAWMRQRQAVNRWLKSRGYEGVNACQKTWAEGPYGRERIGYGPNYELRNMNTPASCVQLFREIFSGSIGDSAATEWMKSLLKRDHIKGDGQTRTFIGKVVPKDCQHYSKAGWAYEVRHDIAAILTPSGRTIVLCIYTDHNVKNLDLLPFLAKEVLSSLGLKSDPPMGESVNHLVEEGSKPLAEHPFPAGQEG